MPTGSPVPEPNELRRQFLYMLAAAEAEGEAIGFAEADSVAAELDRVIADTPPGRK